VLPNRTVLHEFAFAGIASLETVRVNDLAATEPTAFLGCRCGRDCPLAVARADINICGCGACDDVSMPQNNGSIRVPATPLLNRLVQRLGAVPIGRAFDVIVDVLSNSSFHAELDPRELNELASITLSILRVVTRAVTVADTGMQTTLVIQVVRLFQAYSVFIDTVLATSSTAVTFVVEEYLELVADFASTLSSTDSSMAEIEALATPLVVVLDEAMQTASQHMLVLEQAGTYTYNTLRTRVGVEVWSAGQIASSRVRRTPSLCLVHCGQTRPTRTISPRPRRRMLSCRVRSQPYHPMHRAGCALQPHTHARVLSFPWGRCRGVGGVRLHSSLMDSNRISRSRLSRSKARTRPLGLRS
jgi:hypothetical protein